MEFRFKESGSGATSLVALILIDVLLLIPFVMTRAIAILCLGLLIYSTERKFRMLVPASPGFVFWIGNVFVYIIGGIGFNLLLGGEVDGCPLGNCEVTIGLSYLNSALLYVGIGLSCYILGMWFAGVLIKPRTPSRIFEDLNISKYSVFLLSACFVLATIAGADAKVDSVYYNLVIGSIQSIQVLPIIILSIYLLREGKEWLLIGLLFTSRFFVAIQGMILGYGRGQLMEAILGIALTGLAILFWNRQKIPLIAKILLISFPFITVVYFGTASTYRETVQFDTSLSSTERGEILSESVKSVSYSDNFFLDTIGTFSARLFQGHGTELFGLAESGIVQYSGWTFNDLEQALLVYVPKTWYKYITTPLDTIR